MKKARRKIKHFCRLYKYTCSLCQRIRHKRHFAEKGEVCDTCRKKYAVAAIQNKYQLSIFAADTGAEELANIYNPK